MSEIVHRPPDGSDGPVTPYANGGASVPGGHSPYGDDEGASISPARLLAGVRRFWWVLPVAAVVGLAAAWVGYRSATPVYEATGAIWVNAEDTRGAGLGGPIDQGRILSSAAWMDLLRSYAVLDSVAIEEKLFIDVPAERRDLFESFRPGPTFRTGAYALRRSDDGSRWTLYREGEPVESAETGGVLGERLGFLWSPPEDGIPPGDQLEFDLITPRDASNRLSMALETAPNRERNLVRLRLQGPDPDHVARVLQAVMDRHVAVAADLKRDKLDQLTKNLATQLETAREHLEDTERELESFRVATITLPSERSAPIASGLDETRGPVYSDYFRRRVELETLRLDRQRIQAALDTAFTEGLRVEAFELIPSVQTSSQLIGSLAELTDARAELRALEERYTPEYGPVADTRARIERLESATIPAQARSLMAELGNRERELSAVLDSRASELSRIPSRSIEEARLEREREIAQGLFVDLRQRHASAQLAAESSIVDVRILDRVSVTGEPVRDERLRWAFMGLFVSLAAGLGVIVLLDRFSPKIRYLTELTDDMGFTILGVVPRIRMGRKDNAHSVVEAFREIRMRVEFAHGQTRPVMFAVTSPDKGEGKTLVSANLAMAFARMGRKTLVIDADTRRGDLHELLHLQRKPGLTELMAGENGAVTPQPSRRDNLYFLGSGSRRVTAPELLGSERMRDFLAAAKRDFEVIVLDCPPLAAGSDAFVLGVLAGSIVLVARSGSTDKSLARGKLQAFLRLPVRILGAVLNDADSRATAGGYGYHSYYLPEYAATSEDGSEDEERDMVVIEGPTP